jgi:RimJ/RimL family protein N-acetyltransferase
MTRRLGVLDLIGERARLRPHRRADADAAFALIAGRDEILRWLVWDGPSSAAELGEYYERWAIPGEGGVDLRLAIEERASGALAGSLSVRFAGHPGQGDVGYWVGRQFQRQGLGREALELAAHLAFGHLAASSLYAWVFVGNTASRRVLERTGFTLARTVKGRILKRGLCVDEWHFVLLASEWRRLRHGFRPAREVVTWAAEPGPDALEAPRGPLPSG